MSDAASASVSAAPAKKKVTGTKMDKKAANHPPYGAMVHDAIKALKERGGSSRQAIFKYILKNNKLDQNERAVNAHLKLALISGVKKGSLLQSKGVGASGSFKLGAEEKKAKKPKAVGAAKPKAKKPKVAGSPKKAAKPKAKKAAGEHKLKKPKVSKPKSPAKKVANKPKAATKPIAPKVKKPKAVKPKKSPVKPKKVAATKPKKAAAAKK